MMKRTKLRLLSLFFVVLLAALLLIPAAASDAPKLVDEAGLLTSDEAAALNTELSAFAEKWPGFDLVVVTTQSLGGKTAMAYADDYYDYNGYSPDGVLLLIAMDSRDWWISTTGYGITAYTDERISYLGERLVSNLSSGNYAAAFSGFVSDCDELLGMAVDGNYKLPTNYKPGPWLAAALLVGFVLALIPMGVLKNQCKNVAEQAAAANYLRDGSLNMRVSHDRFIRKHLTRTRRAKDEGGSSTHSGSSGTSHGGGGGKF